MFNHRMKQITRPGHLSSRLTCLSSFYIVFLLLQTKMIETRLVWIPRLIANTEESAEYYNAIKSENSRMVSLNKL